MNSESDVLLDSTEYGIVSTASLAEAKTHVLKHGDIFGLFDRHGDIRPTGNGEQGLYHEDTRYLSRMELRLAGQRPTLLSSTVRKDNTLLTADLTNPRIQDRAGQAIPHGTLHLFRAKLLWKGACYEHLRLHNYGQAPVDLAFSYHLDADFADIFEVRGTRRKARGERLPDRIEDDHVVLAYRGLDEAIRRTYVRWTPAPDTCSAHEVHYRMRLAPQERKDIYLRTSCLQTDAAAGDVAPPSVSVQKPSHEDAAARRQQAARRLKEEACQVVTSNEQFNAWVNSSLEDLNLLLTEVPEGYYPYAGIPWYNTFFGRDGLLTALMTLWVNPDIARGVLHYLASAQADEVDPERSAEPGKILHEARKSEMAVLGEVPFDRYYGTVDATPLFVLLAGAYFEHTADRAFIERIWGNIEHALHWIDTYGDADGDGFVEYQPHPNGLTQQGWKDSEDSVFHADGTIARGPIALCEVQGYVYAAKRRAAQMAEHLGKDELARRLRQAANRLRERFEEAFWCEELGTYALALDGDKQPCRVRTSNAGQVLLSTIAEPKRVKRLVKTLFKENSYSKWGIRTVAAKEERYNPMSYHNGSVWPHDNALIGRGLARYGYKEEVHRLLKAFFDASIFDPRRRLAELYCGFVRRQGEGPTPYPVACAPQAWAAAVVFGLLQACLGLRVELAQRRVVLNQPALPAFLQEVELRNLRVGDGTVDLVLQRYVQNVGVEVVNREQDVEVITVA